MDNSQAFPSQPKKVWKRTQEDLVNCDGMTLRDYYKGQIIIALLNKDKSFTDIDATCSLAGTIADALLKERESND